MYALLTDDNALVRVENFSDAPPALAAEKGLRWVLYAEYSASPAIGQVVDGYVEKLENGVWERHWKVRDLTYAERRLSIDPRYASVSEQLDMQWHDAQDGGTRWRDHISAVKAAHPKTVI